jgi:hypothetical protein
MPSHRSTSGDQNPRRLLEFWDAMTNARISAQSALHNPSLCIIYYRDLPLLRTYSSSGQQLCEVTF